MSCSRQLLLILPASLVIVAGPALSQCREEAQSLELRAYHLAGNWIPSMISLVSGWVYSRFVPSCPTSNILGAPHTVRSVEEAFRTMLALSYARARIREMK